MALNYTATYVLSTEDVNDRGFWTLTSGIDLSFLKKHGVALVNHVRYEKDALGGTPEHLKGRLPYGRWNNVRVEGTEVLGDLWLDDTDEDAVYLAGKIADGLMPTASLRLQVIGVSEDPSLIKEGQTRPVLTRSKALEASVCDISSNHSCCKLEAGLENNVFLSISNGNEGKLELVLPLLQNSTTQMDYTEIALSLGLASTATKAEIDAKIAANNQMLSDYRTQEDQRAVQQRATNIEVALSSALSKGKIVEAMRPHYKRLLEANYQEALSLLDNLPAYTPPSQGINHNPAHSTQNAPVQATKAQRYLSLTTEELSGMSKEEASEYALAFVQDLKKKNLVGDSFQR
jgi:hypothetical protein